MTYGTQNERMRDFMEMYPSATPEELSMNTDVPVKVAREYKTAHQSSTHPVHSYNVGESNYSTHAIQPWHIWLEYNLNPWDADIVKRVLRDKPDENRLDYEKIKHICDERIRQIDEETKYVGMARKEGAYSKAS
jgi:hypothetical protein